MTEFSRTDPQFQIEMYKDEPDYQFLASFGEAVLPAMEELVGGDNEMLARRSVHVAGLIGDAGGLAILKQGSEDARATVRVAVAGALRFRGVQKVTEAGSALSNSSLATIVSRLLADDDPSVRRLASKSAGIMRLDSVKTELERLEREDTKAFVRLAAAQALKQIDR